jgi:hypothetical protein
MHTGHEVMQQVQRHVGRGAGVGRGGERVRAVEVRGRARMREAVVDAVGFVGGVSAGS